MSELLEFTKWLYRQSLGGVALSALEAERKEGDLREALASARANTEGWHREFLAADKELEGAHVLNSELSEELKKLRKELETSERNRAEELKRQYSLTKERNKARSLLLDVSARLKEREQEIYQRKDEIPALWALARETATELGEIYRQIDAFLEGEEESSS